MIFTSYRLSFICILISVFLSLGCRSHQFNSAEDTSNSQVASIIDVRGNFLGLKPVPNSSGGYKFIYCVFQKPLEPLNFDKNCVDAFTLKTQAKNSENSALIYPVRIDHPRLKAWFQKRGYSKLVASVVGLGTVVLVTGYYAGPYFVAVLGNGLAEVVADLLPLLEFEALVAIPAGIAGIAVVGTDAALSWGRDQRVVYKNYESIFATQSLEKPHTVEHDVFKIMEAIPQTLGSNYIVNPEAKALYDGDSGASKIDRKN